MSYFQNLFNDYYGYYLVGDSSTYKLTFKVPANRNHGEFFICYNNGPYDLSSFGSDLRFNFAIDPAFKNWSSFDVAVSGVNPSQTTVYEVVEALNSNSDFADWFVASVYNNNQVAVRQKRPVTQMHSYISNYEAEFALKFNKNAGIADIPSYFDKDTIENRFATSTSNNHLIRLGKTITGNSVANPTVVTVANHGLTTGNYVYIVNSNSTPSIDGGYSVTVTGNNTFTIPVNVTKAGTSGEVINAQEAQVLSDANINIYSMLTDYEHLQGRCDGFKFTKNTLDASLRIVTQVIYPAGASAGMLAKKIAYTYTSTNTTPDTITEIPYVLTAADILSP